jgi:hypothetical protein
MSRVALKRPKHGWARTRQEQFDDALNSGIVWCIGLCFFATVSISMIGATITTIEHALAWFA